MARDGSVKNFSPLTAPAETRQSLQSGLQTLGLACDEFQLQQLLDYLALLEKWNAVYNLIAKNDLPELLQRHLLDSLAVNSFLCGTTLLDVGSGAGLPGIPLAILNPDRTFILVDSNGKKTRFLFQVRTVLNLANVWVENCRIEHYQSHKQIDMVLCRAFSSLQSTVAASQHLFCNNSSLLALKGKYPHAELRDLPEGFQAVAVHDVSQPDSDVKRHVVHIKRVD